MKNPPPAPEGNTANSETSLPALIVCASVRAAGPALSSGPQRLTQMWVRFSCQDSHFGGRFPIGRSGLLVCLVMSATGALCQPCINELRPPVH